MSVRVAVGDPRDVTVLFPAEADGSVDVEVHNALTGDTDAFSATHVADGEYTFPLTSAMVAEVNQLTVTFTGVFDAVSRSTSEVVEVAGRHYFTVAEARSLGPIGSEFSDSQIEEMRKTVEDQIESNCETSFVERYTQEGHTGGGSPILKVIERWIQRLLFVSAGGVEVTADIIANDRFFIYDAGWDGQIVAKYARGWSSYPPNDLRMKAIEATRHELNRNKHKGMPSATIAMGTEVGTIRMAVAGLKMPFGYPEVDAVVLKYAEETRADV